MRRTFVLLFLIALATGFMIRSAPVGRFSCTSASSSFNQPLEEILPDAGLILTGTPTVEPDNGTSQPDHLGAPVSAPYRITVSSVLKGTAQENQIVSYVATCPNHGDQGIFVALSDIYGTSYFATPELDWRGTRSPHLYFYPLTEENMATVNQYIDGEPTEPDTGPIYWSDISPTRYAIIALGAFSFLGICVTTIRPKDQEPLDDETRPLIDA